MSLLYFINVRLTQLVVTNYYFLGNVLKYAKQMKIVDRFMHVIMILELGCHGAYQLYHRITMHRQVEFAH